MLNVVEEQMQDAYDSTNNVVQAQSQGHATDPQPQVYLDAEQILMRVFDSSTGKLRTVG